MFLKRRLPAFAPIIAALTLSAPVAMANAATSSVSNPVIAGPSCPVGYAGPTNPATGCPPSLMSYTVTYPGQPSVRCLAGWSPPLAVRDVGAASAPGAAAVSVGRMLPACSAG
jgi:hypothetical protein